MTSALSPTEGSSSSAEGSVLFLSGDLIFASRVQAAATASGREFQLSGSLPEDCSGVGFVVVDLSSRSKVVDGLMDACQTRCPDARVIAYGPHVQVPRLKAAREAGIPDVLTRGQFDAALGGSLFGR